ncbi:MAG: hypothetical protein LC664_10445 [Flavobacteriales bacterium]|nr:hypothetical protein [Flavobacteriales bacterium]
MSKIIDAIFSIITLNHHPTVVVVHVYPLFMVKLMGEEPKIDKDWPSHKNFSGKHPINF